MKPPYTWGHIRMAMSALDRTRVAAVMIAAVAMAYAVVQVASLPATPVLDPDSASYIDFSPYRTATYPLILRILGANGTVLIQPVIYALAAAALCLYVLKIRGRALPAMLVLFGLLSNPELNNYHRHVLTESLFMTSLVMFLVAFMAFFRRPGWSTAAMASLMAGVAATIRPTGYALLLILVVMVMMIRLQLSGRVTVVLAAAVVPMLLAVGAERLYTALVQGSNATSLAGRNMFAKAVLLDASWPASEVTNPAHRVLYTAATETFAPIRDLVNQAPDANIRKVLSENYENCLEWGCVEALRAGLQLPEPLMDTLALQFALERIRAAPLSYLRLVWRNYRAMWVLYSQSHPRLSRQFVEFIQSHRPLPFEHFLPNLVDKFPNSRSAVIVRPAMIAIGWLTGLLGLAALGAAARGRMSDPLLPAGLLAALAVHLTFFWTATVGLGIARFTISMWPLMVAALVFGADSVGCRIFRSPTSGERIRGQC